MSVARLGAVSYLNTRPLVYGLDRRSDLFSIRFDIPAVCAALLHEGCVDVGLIPAIEYARGDYCIVPDIAIGSHGPIASVAVFSRVPASRITSLALDTSSRTSVALVRILCAKRWGVDPELVEADPDLTAMLARADAALIIGDRALAVDAPAAGVTKIDLGEEWHALTGLPFVYAVWAGRAGVLAPEHVAALQQARLRGVAAIGEIAEEVGKGDTARVARVRTYLGDNLKYGLGDAERAGLSRFHALAAELGLIPEVRPLRFYE